MMEKEAFVNYLIEIGGQTPGSANTRARRCEKIEKVEGDLDKAYAEDGLRQIRRLFEYTREDMLSRMPQRHHIPIEGKKGFQSIYEGTQDYRSSLSKYVEFKEYIQENAGELERLHKLIIREIPNEGKTTKRNKAASAEWPNWDGPNEEERLVLSHIITRYVRFLHPKIIEAIAEDNRKMQPKWEELLKECGVDPALYLWSGSPCCFPGVRRHSGTKEINAFKNKTQEFEDAIALDDNSYPKQIWSYVFRDSGFSNYGPDGYQLAHLFDHKDTSSRLSTELKSGSSQHIEAVPGLFTSAANAAYVPTDFLRPTDFESGLRGLLQRKAIDLYSDVCEPLPPGLSVMENDDQRWSIESFDWAEPVGTLEYVEDFLRYRNAKMNELLNERSYALRS